MVREPGTLTMDYYTEWPFNSDHPKNLAKIRKSSQESMPNKKEH